jgi:hypothetical protein
MRQLGIRSLAVHLFDLPPPSRRERRSVARPRSGAGVSVPAWCAPHGHHPMVMKLDAEQRRALNLLADAGPRGSTAAILMAHGFTAEMLAGLVRDGLATVASETVKAGAGRRSRKRPGAAGPPLRSRPSRRSARTVRRSSTSAGMKPKPSPTSRPSVPLWAPRGGKSRPTLRPSATSRSWSAPRHLGDLTGLKNGCYAARGNHSFALSSIGTASLTPAASASIR